MYLFGGLFNLPVGDYSPGKLMGMSIFGLAGEMIKGGWTSSLEFTNGISIVALNGIAENGVKDFWAWLMVSLVAGVMQLLGFVFAIIVLFAMLIAIWKLFVILLKSYVLIVLNVMFAPLLLTLGALPNYAGGFKRWFLAMIGNLSAFVGVFVLLTLYYFIINMQVDLAITDAMSDAAVGRGYFFTPPFVIPVMSGDGQASLALSALSLGLLLTMPSLIEKIRDKMGAKNGFLGEMAKEAVSAVKEGAKVPGKIAGGAAKAGQFVNDKGIPAVKGVQAMIPNTKTNRVLMSSGAIDSNTGALERFAVGSTQKRRPNKVLAPVQRFKEDFKARQEFQEMRTRAQAQINNWSKDTANPGLKAAAVKASAWLQRYGATLVTAPGPTTGVAVVVDASGNPVLNARGRQTPFDQWMSDEQRKIGDV